MSELKNGDMLKGIAAALVAQGAANSEKVTGAQLLRMIESLSDSGVVRVHDTVFVSRHRRGYAAGTVYINTPGFDVTLNERENMVDLIIAMSSSKHTKDDIFLVIDAVVGLFDKFNASKEDIKNNIKQDLETAKSNNKTKGELS